MEQLSVHRIPSITDNCTTQYLEKQEKGGFTLKNINIILAHDAERQQIVIIFFLL
jgi:hypothetical protein